MSSVLRAFSGVFAIALAAMLLMAAIGTASRAAAGGPNLLTNGSFDADVASWNPPGANASLTFAAAEGMPPGAAQLALTVDSAPYSAGFSQCVPATAGFNYTAAADVAGPVLNQPAGTVAFMTMVFNLAADCTGGGIIGTQSGDVTPVSSWQSMGVNLTAPAGTLAVMVVLFLYGSDPAGSEQSLAWFDNVTLTGGIDTPTASPTPTATTTSSTPTPALVTATPIPTSTATPTPAGAASATAVTGAGATATRTATPAAGATQVATAVATPPRGAPGAGAIAPPDTGDGAATAGAGRLAALLSAVALVFLGSGLLVTGLRRR